ncbi:MAG: NAD(P)H-dependent oxidoreductase [Planctomycetota bacterium]|nr:NAD(P)H-dependent oxidoreductase [Planctomycetota bacterium]
MTIRIAAFAGSLRKDSFNRRILAIAAAGAEEAGASVDMIDLNDFQAPLYDGDLESEGGLPPEVVAFKERLAEAQGFLIASPEYNHSLSAALKNIIDWASRGHAKDDPRPCLPGKVAAVLSTSPGHLGGIRGLSHLRAVLHNVGVLVINEQFALPSAASAFGEDGTLKDPATEQQVRDIGRALVRELQLRSKG